MWFKPIYLKVYAWKAMKYWFVDWYFFSTVNELEEYGLLSLENAENLKKFLTKKFDIQMTPG